jgi:hypothetical protein
MPSTVERHTREGRGPEKRLWNLRAAKAVARPLAVLWFAAAQVGVWHTQRSLGSAGQGQR